MKNIILFLIFPGLFLTGHTQPVSFSPRGIGGGGALFFPTINPANDNEFYISCDMSEMFHSTDFGKTYSQVPFTKLQVFGTSTWEFTLNQDKAYSVHNDGNQGYPVQTNDGGNSWIRLPGYDAGLGQVYQLRSNFNKPATSSVPPGYFSAEMRHGLLRNEWHGIVRNSHSEEITTYSFTNLA